MRSIFLCGCRKQKEISKADQIGILAQNFLLCGKLRLEFFRERLSEPEGVALSSAAMVTAAETVQNAGLRLCDLGKIIHHEGHEGSQRTSISFEVSFVNLGVLRG
jgi:hypothetical protein